MKTIKILYEWFFKRLPLGFSIPLLILLGVYFIAVFPRLTYSALPLLTDWVLDYSGILAAWRPLVEIVTAIVVILLVLAGLLAAYNLSAWLYSKWRPRPMRGIEPSDPGPTTNDSGHSTHRHWFR